MSFLDTVRRAKAYLEEQGRVSVSALAREFELDEAHLAPMIEELVAVQRVAAREGKVLSWIGSTPSEPPAPEPVPEAATAAETIPKASPEPAEPLATTEGQRRQVTVLFGDLADYTPLAERLGEEATYHLIGRVLQELVRVVEAQLGTVQDLAGDGVMAVFGAPLALEDAPRRACLAALEMQRRMRELAEEIYAEHGARPRLRIGIHSGPVVVGPIGAGRHMESRAVGDTVNLAARLQAQAEPDTVVLSEATRRLVAGYTETEPLGETAIKGKSQAEPMHRLAAVEASVTRFELAQRQGLTPLVARKPQLDQLRELWRTAAAGKAQIVGLTGDAGIGKSRLAHEFVQRVGDEGTLLYGACAADERARAFLPYLGVVRGAFRIGEREAREVVERKLLDGLEMLGMRPHGTLPYLLNLLGFDTELAQVRNEDAEVIGIRTRDVLCSLLRQRCRLSPVLLFVDDVHWMDSASEEVLVRIAERETDVPLLVLSTCRPPYRPPWQAAPHATELHLEPLSRNATVELLKARFETDDLPETLVQLVVEKTQGNPLFAEEIARYLLDRGSVFRDDAGLHFANDALDGMLPANLQNLLMERIDRLDDPSRAVVDTAAVIGGPFTAELLEVVRGANGSLAGVLADLEQQGILQPAEGEGKHCFRHALIRDAAYDSLLSERRTRIHERVADALEGVYADRLSEAADSLAHHYGQTARADKAVRYLTLAGEASMRLYSLDEAEQHFREALALADANPGCVDDAFLSDLLLDMARTNYFRCDFRSTVDRVGRYLPVVEALGDPKRLGRFLFELAYAQIFAGEGAKAESLLLRALEIGERERDESAMAYAYMGLVWHRNFFAAPGETRRSEVAHWAPLAAATGAQLGDVWLQLKALFGWAWHECFDGRLGASRRLALRMIELSRETDDPRPKVLGLWQLSAIHLFDFGYEEAVAQSNEALRISLCRLDRTMARVTRGGALILLRKPEEGVESLDLAREIANPGSLQVAEWWADFYESFALILSGNLKRGFRTLAGVGAREGNAGMPLAPFTQLGLGESYLLWRTGDVRPPFAAIMRNLVFVALTQPVVARRARGHLETALAWLREMNHPAGEAWALYDLALLHRAQHEPGEARACLEQALDAARRAESDLLEEKIAGALRE